MCVGGIRIRVFKRVKSNRNNHFLDIFVIIFQEKKFGVTSLGAQHGLSYPLIHMRLYSRVVDPYFDNVDPDPE